MIYTNCKCNLQLWVFILIGTILLYLIFGTGLHGDDYSVIKHQTMPNFLLLTPENLGLAIFGVPTYLTFWWTYPVLGHEYQWGYDLVKWLAHLASVYMGWRFFTTFISSEQLPSEPISRLLLRCRCRRPVPEIRPTMPSL